MTKKLEELFNLPEKEINPIPKAINEEIVEKATEVKSLDDSIQEVERITQGLPQMVELNDLNDGDLDNLAAKAEQAYDDLMDLGMNVEVRYASRIFEVAGGMLKNAIDAKSAKVDKKLKAIDLQLKKLKIDNDAGIDPNNVINGQGYVITDRNELLKKLSGKA